VQHVDDGEFIFIYIWAMFLTSCFI
jgi:hypothetical protein